MKYFLHDTSSFEDEKIVKLFSKYGYEGLGLFYTALEKLARAEKPIDEMVLKQLLRLPKRLEKCWYFIQDIGLLQVKVGDVFNENLLKVDQKFLINKEKTRKRVEAWRAKQTENQEDINSVTCYSNDPVTPVTLVNKDKVNKSKVNKESVKEKFNDRKQKFALSLEPYKEIYPREMLIAFVKYWTEPNKSQTKFRQELQKTWELSRRLDTWASREKITTNGKSKSELYSESIKSLDNFNYDYNQ